MKAPAFSFAVAFALADDNRSKAEYAATKPSRRR